MSDIKNLRAVDTLSAGDLVAVYSTTNGGTRKAPASAFVDAIGDSYVDQAEAQADAAALTVSSFQNLVYPGVYPVAPTTRPNGGAMQDGDRAVILLGGLPTEYLRSGGAWIVPNVGAANLAAPTGSSLVGFLQAGTGAVEQTGQDKMRERLSVTDFFANGVSGARVDPAGVLDSTLGIAAAFAAAAGRDVEFPPGVYRVTSTVEITAASQNVIGHGATIRYEGAVFTPAFLIKGSAASALTVTAAIAQYAKTFSLSAPDAATLAAGDWVKLYSTENYFVNTGRDYKKGELVQVASVAGTTVTIVGQGVQLDYSASFTITAQKLNLLQGGTFTGLALDGLSASSNRVLVEARYVRGFNFVDGELTRSEVGVKFTTCLGGRVLRNYIHGINLAGTGYGVSVEGSSAFIEFAHNQCEDNRHSFTTGGYDGVCMFLSVHHNKAFNHMVNACFNTHGNARFVNISDNDIDNCDQGVSFYSPYTNVCRNTIRNAYESAVLSTEAGNINCVVTDNIIGKTSEAFFSAIHLEGTATSTELNRYVNVSRNTIEETTNGNGVYVNATAVTVTADSNIVYRYGYQAVKLINGDNYSIRNNTIFQGLRASEVTIQADCSASPNSVTTVFGTAVNISGNNVARGSANISVTNADVLVLSANLVNTSPAGVRYTLTNVTTVRGDILRSPDGTLFRLAVDNAGVLSTIAAA